MNMCMYSGPGNWLGSLSSKQSKAKQPQLDQVALSLIDRQAISKQAVKSDRAEI